MQLTWSTFLLEIINFLVLVWILTRFLYRPVLAVIARRRAAIDEEIARAASMRRDSEALEKRYQGRIDAWNDERRTKLEALNRELDMTRASRLAELQKTLEAERERAKAVAAEREAEAARRVEREALAQGARFASRLLERAAGPEAEARLTDLAIEALGALPADRAAELRGAPARPAPTASVSSAFDLPATQRERLASTLEHLLGAAPRPTFAVDPTLLAGIRIAVGPWILGLNLRDELAGFVRLAHER